jgi:uncharacterized membrane protein YhaH (DUF805 family)
MSDPNPGSGWNAPPAPAYQPPAQMGMGEAVSSVLSKYATLSGRARRSEYWWFYLAYVLADVVAAIVDAVLGTFLVEIVLVLALLLPVLAVGVRRLHDIGKSGWWLLIALIPLVGAIVLLVFTCQDSEPGTNQWGPSPKYGA